MKWKYKKENASAQNLAIETTDDQSISQNILVKLNPFIGQF